MNTSFFSPGERLARLVILVFAGFLFGSAAARAGLTLNMQLFQYAGQNSYTYYFDPQLATNTTASLVPFGDYYLTSFGIPTNGSSSQWHYDTNGFNQVNGQRYGYGDYNSMLHELTNGLWTLYVTNTVATNVYHFTVKLNITSNDLPKVLVTYPPDGAIDVTNQPTFTWQGPTNYSTLVLYEYNNSPYLPVTLSSYTSPVVLYDGPNDVTLHYESNSVTAVTTTMPTNSLLQAYPGWIVTSKLTVSYDSRFTVGLPDTSGSYHTLVAHYPFDATNGSVLGAAAALDISGNGLNLTFSNSFGAAGGVNLTNDSVAGIGALQFHDGDGASGGVLGWASRTPSLLLSTLAGSFSVSCWIKTTQNMGYNTFPAYYGAGIVSADVAGLANDVIPIALDGGGVACNTGGSADLTLNSVATVNDGNYHHVVVTRNQQTGQKIIYIDGAFDSFSTASTNLLSDPLKLTIGALANAGNADPNDGSYYQGYDGELDDLQIYSGVLSASDAASLYASPGTTVANGSSAANDYDPFLVARYNFENTNNPYADSSTNANNPDCGSSDGTNNDTFSTDAAVGLFARDYFGNTSFCFTQSDPAYQNLSNALSGNFSVTAWVKTTNSVSGDTANAYYGAPIFFAGADYNNHCTIPLSITGSKAAFTIVDTTNTVTLQSSTVVNDGKYHFLAVTRQQATGLMSIYVDGALETTGIGITNPVVTQGYISIAGGYYFYAGLLDDVRLYSTNLSAGDVADIYNGGNGITLAEAIGDTHLSVTTSGDANWFVENTNTDNGALYAVQSGSVTNYQSSTLTTVVTGPGTLTFNWSNIANDPNQGFDCEFYVDDPNTNDIADLYSGVNAWQSIQYTAGHSISIPPGQHTLGWIVYPNGDTDPTEAAYVDNLVFTPPATNPVSGNFTLGIIRQQDAALGDIYFAFPSFNSITPAATVGATNRLESPNNYFNLNSTSGGDSPSSAILYSLNSVLNECTNGLWSLYIDYGAPDQRQFQFSLSIAGLTTNLIPAVRLITPTNGATGIPLNTAYEWVGPSNYSTLYVDKQYVDGSGYVGTSLPATDTNWPSPPMLVAGTNQFYISYSSNSFPNVNATLPVDSNDVQTATSWTAGLNLSSAATANFVVKASAMPFALKNSRNGGGNFQFTFQSQSGYASTIYYRTNLQTGQWLAWTNFPGDGTVKTSTVPLTLFSPSRLGFIRVGAQ